MTTTPRSGPEGNEAAAVVGLSIPASSGGSRDSPPGRTRGMEPTFPGAPDAALDAATKPGTRIRAAIDSCELEKG